MGPNNLLSRRLQRGVNVELVAEAHEILAQLADLHARRDADGHADREHRCAGVRRRVGPGSHFLDIDLTAGEELGDVVHDAGLVHGHHVHEVRHHIGFDRARLGVLDGGGEVEFLADDRHLAFEFGDRAPTAGDEYHQRKLAAEYAHTAVLDVAAVVEDDLGHLVDNAGTVLTDGGNDEKLLHDEIKGLGCTAWEGSEVYHEEAS